MLTGRLPSGSVIGAVAKNAAGVPVCGLPPRRRLSVTATGMLPNTGLRAAPDQSPKLRSIGWVEPSSKVSVPVACWFFSVPVPITESCSASAGTSSSMVCPSPVALSG